MIIRGMDKPRFCCECPLKIPCGDGFTCLPQQKQVHVNLKTGLDDNCPIEAGPEVLRRILPDGSTAPIEIGQWVQEHPGTTDTYLKKSMVCSSCRDYFTRDFEELNFCPRCGAFMIQPDRELYEDPRWTTIEAALSKEGGNNGGI